MSAAAAVKVMGSMMLAGAFLGVCKRLFSTLDDIVRDIVRTAHNDLCTSTVLSKYNKRSALTQLFFWQVHS